MPNSCNLPVFCEYDALRPLPATPPEVIAEVVRDTVILGEHTFLIDKPGGSDELLKHPAVVAAFAVDEYLPYWADLWPAARMLAKAILTEPFCPSPLRGRVRVGGQPADPPP